MEDDTLKDSSKISQEEKFPTDEEDNTESQTMEDEKDSFPLQQDDEELMRTTKAQVGEAREENQRLKQLLADIVKEYHSLQSNFSKIIQHKKVDEKELKDLIPTQKVNGKESDFISLSLGRSNSNEALKKEDTKTSTRGSNDEREDANLSLALDCKLEADSSMAAKSSASLSSSEDNNKVDDPVDTWPPNKSSKNNARPSDDVVLQQPQAKKTRVSVRARCDTPTMHDGCQWRKYGQKIAKGNPCPRAYYRCTISPNCPVRKQVQRCVEDLSILVTTYEGTHNHPLPLSATSMASTTSAAVSMLNSNSSTSEQVGSLASSISAPISSNGLQFSLPQNPLRPHQFPFQSTSISTYNSHPTITLDLTNPKATSPHMFSSRVPSSSTSPFSQPYLNFAPPAQQATQWNTSFPSYGTVVQKQPSFEDQSLEAAQQAISTEAITAATKILIASNPTLRNALAAAISSLTGNGNVGTRDSGFGNNAAGQHVGFGPSLPLSSPSTQSGTVACGSSYLKPSQTTGNQQSSLSLFPLLPHSSSKSTSTGSPSDSKDHTK